MNNGTIENQGQPFKVLSDYDVKTVDVIFNEANSNTYSSVEDWIPNKESENGNNLNNRESQEIGIVALPVYKKYWNSVGSLIGWLLFISMVIMQVNYNYIQMKKYSSLNRKTVNKCFINISYISCLKL